MSDTENVEWQELEDPNNQTDMPADAQNGELNLEAIYDVPVRVSAVLGKQV